MTAYVLPPLHSTLLVVVFVVVFSNSTRDCPAIMFATDDFKALFHHTPIFRIMSDV